MCKFNCENMVVLESIHENYATLLCGDYQIPIVAEVTSDIFDRESIGKTISLDLLLYSQKIEIYSSSEEFNSAHKNRAPESLIPMRLPCDDGEYEFVAVSATIDRVEISDDHTCFALEVQCLGCNFVIFVSAEDVAEAPEPGQILYCIALATAEPA